MQTVRIVRARHVLTSGALGEVRDGAVAVDDGRILAVGSWATVRDRFPDAEVHGDGTGILTPGFVNSHGHFSEGLVTGLGETATLWEWFVEVVEPIEPHLTREMAYVGTLLKGAEMALSGVTTVNDMFCHAPGPGDPVTPGVVDALDELGLRGEVSFGAADDANPRPVDTYLAEHQALADAAAASRRCRFRMSAATVPSVSAPLWRETVRLAQEVGRLHIHFHEVREEVTAWRMEHRLSPIQYAAREGLLDAQVVAAHCVWLDDDDVATLAAHGVAVAHNPVSNMILASGVCPVPRLRREGIVVGLGTDGPASNDSQDMVETLKIAALLQKVHHLQARALTAPQVLEMATIGGARALGLDGEIGSLEVGKSADLVLFSEHCVTLANIHDPYQKLVYCASGREVSDVWVGGEPVVAGGRLVTVDVERHLPRARELATKLARDAGLPSALLS